MPRQRGRAHEDLTELLFFFSFLSLLIFLPGIGESVERWKVTKAKRKRRVIEAEELQLGLE